MATKIRYQSLKVGVTEKRRLAQLESCVPKLWSHKKVLYVGANVNRFFFRTALIKHAMNVTVLEVSNRRCAQLRKLFPNLRVLYGNVVDVQKFHESWDSVWWFHGPTMLSRVFMELTIRKLEGVADLVILACPWGRYVNGPSAGSLDTSKFAAYEKDFRILGYKTDAIGKKDVEGSNLLAWKFV